MTAVDGMAEDTMADENELKKVPTTNTITLYPKAAPTDAYKVFFRVLELMKFFLPKSFIHSYIKKN
jgi:hypothetical protein